MIKKICYFGTYDREYPRNCIIMEGLKRNGISVLECHAQLWNGTGDNTTTQDKDRKVLGEWHSWTFLIKVLCVYIQLVKQYLMMEDHDVVIVGYTGHFDIFLARGLSWIRRKPVILDAFIPLKLILQERQLDVRGISSSLIKWAEKWACCCADMVLLDTDEHLAFLVQNYHLSPHKFRLLPIGADERYFYPVMPMFSKNGRFNVVFFGKYMALHGVDTIIRAAKLLESHSDIHFELIGEGQTKKQMQQIASSWNLSNVSFIGWVDKSEIATRLATADVCLGIFGDTLESQCTVQNKIYEGLALRKPLITGSSDVVCKVLTNGENAFLCPRADPQALAEAILTLRNEPNLREHIAKSGYRLFTEKFTTVSIGRQVQEYLDELIILKRKKRV